MPEDRAALVVRQLMSEAMFSGWGVRTLSTQDRGFNPIGYHLGTIWPHDNSLIAMGLARYGYREEANRIAIAQIEAASHFAYRLPEAFSGYPRSVSRFPVPYPTACSPQAWSTAAPLALLRAMLGLNARHGELTLDPVLPESLRSGRRTWHRRVRLTLGRRRDRPPRYGASPSTRRSALSSAGRLWCPDGCQGTMAA